MTQENIIPYEERSVTKQQREKINGHRSVIMWFTGLSGAGKSTLSHTVEAALVEKGVQAYVLDGDNMRTGISNDLGFSPEDRVENIRRIGEVSKLFLEAGVITLSAFISPYRKDRQIVRALVEDSDFIEVYVKCPLDVCESRDPKGLYKKARSGEIAEFTGVSAPYEEPENPEIVVNTSESSIEDSVRKIIQYLEDNKLI